MISKMRLSAVCEIGQVPNSLALAAVNSSSVRMPLFSLGLLLLCPAAHAPARDVRATAHHSRAHQRASPNKYHCLLAG